MSDKKVTLFDRPPDRKDELHRFVRRSGKTRPCGIITMVGVIQEIYIGDGKWRLKRETGESFVTEATAKEMERLGEYWRSW